MNQILSLVKYETLCEVPQGSWSYMRQYLDPNDDETYTINKKDFATLIKMSTLEEQKRYKPLLDALRKLCDENVECYVAIT